MSAISAYSQSSRCISKLCYLVDSRGSTPLVVLLTATRSVSPGSAPSQNMTGAPSARQTPCDSRGHGQAVRASAPASPDSCGMFVALRDGNAPSCTSPAHCAGSLCRPRPSWRLSEAGAAQAERRRYPRRQVQLIAQLSCAGGVPGTLRPWPSPCVRTGTSERWPGRHG